MESRTVEIFRLGWYRTSGVVAGADKIGMTPTKISARGMPGMAGVESRADFVYKTFMPDRIPSVNLSLHLEAPQRSE
jgi:hypothetical protein